MMIKTRVLAAVLGCAGLLAVSACGGGGGGDSSVAGPVAATTTFSVRNGFAARVASGSNDNLTISGTCLGTAQIINGASNGAVFEGVSGFSATQTNTVNFTNCSPSSSTATGTNYYDANYTPIGTLIPSLEYSKFSTAPSALPSAAAVGDTADYATLTTYTDSTKATTTGRRVLSYVIEADTATTVIVNFIVRTYDTTPQLQLTQQTRYRMAANGTLSLVTIDIQYSGSLGTAHLVYTKV